MKGTRFAAYRAASRSAAIAHPESLATFHAVALHPMPVAMPLRRAGAERDKALTKAAAFEYSGSDRRERATRTNESAENAMKRSIVLPCLLLATAAMFCPSCGTAPAQGAEEKRVLLYTRNGLTLAGKKGFVHDNIAASVEAIKKLGEENGFAVDVSDDPKSFTDENLKKYKALVFSNTNNEVFDTEEQKKALQNYVHAGGGIAGIHSACAMMRNWPWMWQLMGGTFEYHPKFQPFTIKVVDRKHPSTAHLGETWEWQDEFYFLKEMPKDLHILLEGDLTKLDDKRKPQDEKSRPLAWCHEFEGGRVWFTALGHKKEAYADPVFLKHILGGIQWAMGDKK